MVILMQSLLYDPESRTLSAYLQDVQSASKTLTISKQIQFAALLKSENLSQLHVKVYNPKTSTVREFYLAAVVRRPVEPLPGATRIASTHWLFLDRGEADVRGVHKDLSHPAVFSSDLALCATRSRLSNILALIIVDRDFE